MSIIYLQPEIPENATSANVVFIDESDGKQFIRSINIPYNSSNNTVNLIELNTRLEEHLRSVIYKREMGTIVFIDPNNPPNP
jgi:hypothetical protein